MGKFDKANNAERKSKGYYKVSRIDINIGETKRGVEYWEFEFTTEKYPIKHKIYFRDGKPNSYASAFLFMIGENLGKKGEQLSDTLERIDGANIHCYIVPYKEWYVWNGELKYSTKVFEVTLKEPPQTVIDEARAKSDESKKETEKELPEDADTESGDLF